MKRNKILLVDDDPEFRTEFRECMDDYDIVEASTGEEALGILSKPNEIDLVVLDIKMPGTSGTEVLSKIKESAPDLGIIIITGHSSEDIAIKALKNHADDYIKKPFDIYRTKETIEKLLEKKDPAWDGMDSGLARKIEKVKSFSRRNCLKKLSLNDAASAVSLSPKYLSRVFKERTGIRFSDYRLGLKLSEAKAILRNTGKNVNEIALCLGYQNAESFVRMFKKLTGETPKKYRENGRIKKTGRRSNKHADK